MRNIVLAFTFFSLLSCKKPEDKTQIETSRAKDINEIVQAVITEDSLNVLKSVDDSRNFCEDLIKLKVFIPEKTKNGEIPPPPPPSFNDVSIEDLLHYKKSGIFSAKDSLTLLRQNSNPEKFKIDKFVFEKVNLTTRENEASKRKAGKSFSFYEMTIPIFSLDNQSAYVALNHFCGGLCGNGISIYLKKINGKWKIVEKWQTWIS